MIPKCIIDCNEQYQYIEKVFKKIIDKNNLNIDIECLFYIYEDYEYFAKKNRFPFELSINMKDGQYLEDSFVKYHNNKLYFFISYAQIYKDSLDRFKYEEYDFIKSDLVGGIKYHYNYDIYLEQLLCHEIAHGICYLMNLEINHKNDWLEIYENLYYNVSYL